MKPLGRNYSSWAKLNRAANPNVAELYARICTFFPFAGASAHKSSELYTRHIASVNRCYDAAAGHSCRMSLTTSANQACKQKRESISKCRLVPVHLMALHPISRTCRFGHIPQVGGLVSPAHCYQIVHQNPTFFSDVQSTGWVLGIVGAGRARSIG